MSNFLKLPMSIPINIPSIIAIKKETNTLYKVIPKWKINSPSKISEYRVFPMLNREGNVFGLEKLDNSSHIMNKKIKEDAFTEL